MDKHLEKLIKKITKPLEKHKEEELREPSLKSSRSQTPTECCTAVSEANVQHDGNRRLVARSAAPQEPSVSGTFTIIGEKRTDKTTDELLVELQDLAHDAEGVDMDSKIQAIMYIAADILMSR